MIFILDKSENVVGVINNRSDITKSTPFFDDKYIPDLDTGAETFEFTTIANSPQGKHISVGNYVAFLYKGTYKLFSIVEVTEIHKEVLYKTAYCECIGLELLNEILRPVSIASANVRQFMENALSNTSFNLGYVDESITDVFTIEISDYQNVYKVIQDNLTKYGAELEFRFEINKGRLTTRYIDVYKQRGNITKRRFEYNRNILSIKKTIDTSEIASAMIGVGTNNLNFKTVEWSTSNGNPTDKPLNQDFVTDQEAYAKWNSNGSHIMAIYKMDTTSPTELLAATYKELLKRKEPKVKYELDVALLEELIDIDDINLGDTVYVVDHEFDPPLYLSARISKLEISFTNPNSNKCILANFKEVKSNITSEIKNIESKITPTALKQTIKTKLVDTGGIDKVVTPIGQFDVNGLTVLQQVGETVSGNANLNSEGLTLYDANGQQRASFGQNDFAYVKDLQVENIDAPRIVQKRDTTQPISWYVAPVATGDGTGQNVDNKANSINQALENAFKSGNVLSRQDITINIAAGTYNEDIYIGGYMGAGIISLYFDKGVKLTGVHIIEENIPFIYWHGGRTTNSLNEGCQLINDGSRDDLIINRSSHFTLVGFRADNKNKGSLVTSKYGATTYLNIIDLVNSYYPSKTWFMSKTAYVNCRGSNITNLGHITEGSQLNTHGATFDATQVPYIQNAGQHVDIGVTKTASLYSPVGEVYTWLENSFSLSNYRSTKGSSTIAGEYNQANWGSYTDYKGFADIPSSLKTWCTGGRNFTLWVTVKRKTTSHGYAGAVPTPRFKRPDGTYWNSGVAMARGESKTIQLPSDMANAIVGGTMTVLEVFDTSQDNYIQFETNVSIKVKCEKLV